LFEKLKRWPRILVTGPQRSGTRIATQMIAQDTGHWFVGEEGFGTDSVNKLLEKLETGRNMVIQCPAMSPFVNLFGMHDADLFVVMVQRDQDDIRASRKRIGWRWEMAELIRCLNLEGDSAEIKYRFWSEFQKGDLKHRGMDLEYESLSEHPLWIPKEKRGRFGARQTA